MTCRTFRQELERQLAKTWETGNLNVEDSFLRHARECRDCGARLSAAMTLTDRTRQALTPPADLVARVDERIAREGWKTAHGRSPGRIFPLAAAAVLLVGLSSLISIFAVRAPDDKTVEVRLVLEAPSAHDVVVVGDWNGWDRTAQPMTDPDHDGTWEIRFRVEPGREYEYQFVIDGSDWIADPASLFQIDDGFGGTNSVLDI